MEENQNNIEENIDRRVIEDQSKSINKIALALSKAQSEIEGAKKNSQGHFNNTYADLHTVIGSCKNILSKYEIAFVQGNRFKDGVFLCVTKLIHSSGQWLSSEMALPVPKNANPQQIGSLNTYGRRYGLASMAGVAQYDDDANLSSGINSQPVTK